MKCSVIVAVVVVVVVVVVVSVVCSAFRESFSASLLDCIVLFTFSGTALLLILPENMGYLNV